MSRTKQTARKHNFQAPRKSVAPNNVATKAVDPDRKTRRYKPGTRAIMNIKKLQKTTKCCISKSPFQRLVISKLIELTSADGRRPDFRLKKSAALALQEACEGKLIRTLGKTQLAAIKANRVTIREDDVDLVHEIIKN